MKLKLLLAMLLASQALHAETLIPQPAEQRYEHGKFVINSRTTLVYSPELRDAAIYLLDYLPLKRLSPNASSNNSLRLATDPSLAPEEYRLTVNSDGIVVQGGGYGGVFNGIQTLLQLLPDGIYAKNRRLPAEVVHCEISDKPRFDYRGLLLDVARTWIPAERLKRYIDLMAYHKINKLHLHLADDEGWRIEIKSHPELAQKGGFRGGDSPVHPRYAKFDEKWGGYYTRSQMRGIVAYAMARNIEIIPEIDMPGHSRALAAIHPEILCGYTPDTSATNGLDLRNVWCVARESNYELIDDIIRELSEIFPSKYIHIGGDEVDVSQWESCPDCRRLKREKGLQSGAQLENLFISRVSEILSRYGKRPAVWNEAVKGGLLRRSTRVYGWQSMKHCLEAADKGYPTIVMPGEYLYFDMKQSPSEAGHTWAAIFDAKKVLSLDLRKSGFDKRLMERVEGIEATFFSEIYIAHNPESNDYLDYMLFPRLCAASEVAWCGERKRGWDEFYESLKGSHYGRMNSMGIAFRLSTPKVTYADGTLSASVDDGSEIYVTDIRSGESSRYIKPITTDEPENYIFASRYGKARSRDVAGRERKRLKPEVSVTSSMPFSAKNPASNAESYSGRIARTVRAAHAGDWILYTFSEPVRCSGIEIGTGHLHLRRCLFLKGRTEISYDGKEFTESVPLHEGSARFAPKRPVRAVRIVAEGNSDAEDNVVVQSPTITE